MILLLGYRQKNKPVIVLNMYERVSRVNVVYDCSSVCYRRVDAAQKRDETFHKLFQWRRSVAIIGDERKSLI